MKANVNRGMGVFLLSAAFLLLVCLFAVTAFAQFGTPEGTNPSALLGSGATQSSCSGAQAANRAACEAASGTWVAGSSNTGVYELSSTVQTGLSGAILIALLFVGFMLARRVVASYR